MHVFAIHALMSSSVYTTANIHAMNSHSFVYSTLKYTVTAVYPNYVFSISECFVLSCVVRKSLEDFLVRATLALKTLGTLFLLGMILRTDSLRNLAFP